MGNLEHHNQADPESRALADEVLELMDAKEDQDDEAQAAQSRQPQHLQEPPRPRIASYDFKHPARVNKDQLRTLENLHDNFARLLSSTFSGAMRAVVDVDTAFVDQTTYAEFIMSLSNPSCSYQFTLGPTNGQAIIDVAMPVVFGFVDRTFGGKGSSQGVEARQMTPIEIGVINRITKRVIEDLEATWEPVQSVEIADIELETNPEFMQITAASEIVILLAFEVNSTNASGLVSLCYPFFTLESILPRLGQQNYVRRSRLNQEELNRQNLLRLGPIDVPMVAELGRTKISLQEAESLKAGDIIRLPTRTTEPALVYLGGKPKFVARPFAEDNGELKLQVVNRLPAGLQGKYGTVVTTSEPSPAPFLLPAEAGASENEGKDKAAPALEQQEEKPQPEPQEVDLDEELDPLAEEMGVRIVRVEMQVAGSIRQVPQKIMPDQNDSECFVMVAPDSASGELVPQVRRGAKRYVEEGPEDVWRLADEPAKKTARAATGALTPQDIRAEIRALKDLPVMPAPHGKLLKLLGKADEEVDLGQVAALLEQDPALSARIVQTCRAAYFGFQGSLMKQAIAFLGVAAIRTIVQSAVVYPVFEGESKDGARMQLRDLWRHSLATGLAMEILGASDKGKNHFLLGALHDIGKVVFLCRFPAHYDRVLDLVEARNISILTAEQELLGITHTECGSELAQHWDLPAQVRNAIEAHHEPSRARQHRRLAAKVHLADIAVRTMQIGYAGDALIPAVDSFARGVGTVEELVRRQQDLVEQVDSIMEGIDQ